MFDIVLQVLADTEPVQGSFFLVNVILAIIWELLACIISDAPTLVWAQRRSQYDILKSPNHSNISRSNGSAASQGVK